MERYNGTTGVFIDNFVTGGALNTPWGIVFGTSSAPVVGGVTFPIANTSAVAVVSLIEVGLVLGVAALGGAAWYARRRR